MRAGIISDTHDNLWKLDQALPTLRMADLVIHCGDLCSPFMIRRLGEGIQAPIHIVWGNNEGDRLLISKVAEAYPQVHLHGGLAQLEVEGIRIGVHHYPEVAVDLARSGSYDMVCYGHDHTAFEGMSGGCLLLNPGELLGLKGKSTFTMVELPGRQVEWFHME
jgi:putative phosphoesterase